MRPFGHIHVLHGKLGDWAFERLPSRTTLEVHKPGTLRPQSSGGFVGWELVA